MVDNLDYAKIIKAKISLIDYIGKDLKLVKSGTNYKALCPFHNEKTPSFVINQHKNTFNCFGCGKSGDIFTYLMEKYRIEFKEALNILANEAGVTLQYDNSNNREVKKLLDNKKKYFYIMNLISKHYHKNLKESYSENTKINAFLKNKQIDLKIIEKYELGYAKNTYTVIDFLKEHSIDSDNLENLGIYKKNNYNKVYDAFTNRIVFPIKNKLDQTLGFGGRILEGSGPKYINSFENDFFKKRYTLYNINNLKNINSKSQKLFIVEGYTDVIAMEKKGYHAVAPLGTAVSIDQLSLAWHYNNQPIILFDGDEAGKKASFRVLELALSLIEVEKTLDFIFLDNNYDPDTILNKENGKNMMDAYINNKNSFIEVLIKSEIEDNLDVPERILLFKKKLFKKIQSIKSEEVKSLYKYIINEKIQQNLRESVKKTNYSPLSSNKDNQFIKKFKDRKEEQFVLRRERSILGAMINNFKLLKENDEVLAELYISNNELSKLRDSIIDSIASKNIQNSEQLKNYLIDVGLSKIIKNHFITDDCIKFNLIENYANENTNINDAKKALMDVILLQEKWYKRKNKNLSNIT